MLLAQEYLGTKPLRLWQQLHVALWEGETGDRELKVGMRWKDVLSESVLEKEGKSEQERPKAARGASPQPATTGGGGRQGTMALINTWQARRRAAPVHRLPAQASAAASMAVGAVITTGGSWGKSNGERAA